MFQEFPKAIYLNGNVQLACVVVFDKAEEAAKLKDGYEPGKSQEAIDDTEALKSQAEALGIKVDARWGVKRLSEEITKAS